MFISLQKEVDRSAERIRPPASTVQSEAVPLRLWWGMPATARHFNSAGLRAGDLARNAAPRSTGADLDWRVSRALVAAARVVAPTGVAARAEPVISLSHKRGHAVVLAAPASSLVGVDLEVMQPRDFTAFCRWVATPEEAAVVLEAGAADRARRFYALWTAKEALLKALNLAFPADMSRVGWHGPDNGASLRAPEGSWRGLSMVLGGRWMVTAVWAASTDDAAGTDASGVWWAAGPGATLPSIEVAQRYV